MSDRFVTVASYAFTPEAQIAKNLLEAEGIPAFLVGELAANAMTGAMGEARLQVREEDAPRAVSLLAAAAARVRFDEDWEARAEKDASVCALCGIALPTGATTCPACGTSNARITTDRRDTWAARPREPASEGMKPNDQVQAESPRQGLHGQAVPETDSATSAKGCAVVLVVLPIVALWLIL
jgi:hypothetical protein